MWFKKKVKVDYTKMIREDFEKLLFSTFPFYAGHKLTIYESCMPWGLEHGPGWYNILWEMSEKLVKAKPPETFQFTQIKEKFGTGRFYWQGAGKKIQKIVDKYEHMTYYTCESCGRVQKPTTVREGGWVYNMCDECWKVFNEKRRHENDDCKST